MKNIKSHTQFLVAQLIILLVTTSPLLVRAQSYSDSTQRLNVLKFDLSSNLIYSDAYALTYERLIKKNQTASITFGTERIKGIASRIEGDSIRATEKRAQGFKVAADYRFYLGKENRYNAPHGVYIGPYVAYHQFENNFDMTVSGDNGDQNGNTSGKFQVTNIGFQAGYQFLIGNRWSIDMTFIGTSISNYRVRMNVNGNFDIDDSNINQALLEALKEKFPLFEELMDNQEIDQSGRLETWGLGYRYQFHIGYAFGGGGKKK